MSIRKGSSGLFSQRQLEMTQKYFFLYMEETIKFMMYLFDGYGIQNVSWDDCEDLYNEIFTYAIKTFDSNRGSFKYYLHRIAKTRTIDAVRRVIGTRDPLYFSNSLDQVLENGVSIHEVIGHDDQKLVEFDGVISSPESTIYELTPLDKTILYYRGMGYSLREIAALLNVSLSTVRRRILSQRKNKKLLSSLNKLD